MCCDLQYDAMVWVLLRLSWITPTGMRGVLWLSADSVFVLLEIDAWGMRGRRTGPADVGDGLGAVGSFTQHVLFAVWRWAVTWG